MIEFLKKLVDLPAILLKIFNLFRKTPLEQEQKAKDDINKKIDEMGRTGRG